MSIGLGVHVQTSDGKDIGTVDKLILDPATERIKAAVVRKGTLLPRDVEVPLEMIQEGTGDPIRLTYTADQVDRLPEFFEGSYTMPPANFVPPGAYPVTGLYLPLGYGIGAAPAGVGLEAPGWPYQAGSAGNDEDREVAAALQRQDLENAVIGEGSDVLDKDGERVGKVHALTFDPDTSELTSIVVRKGLLPPKDSELPASLIESVDDGAIYLKVAADQIKM